MKNKLVKSLGVFALGLCLYLIPLKEDSYIFGRYILGDNFAEDRYFIEKTIEGVTISYIRINPDDFKIRRIDKGDLITLEEIVSKNIFNAKLKKESRITIQRNPKEHS